MVLSKISLVSFFIRRLSARSLLAGSLLAGFLPNDARAQSTTANKTHRTLLIGSYTKSVTDKGIAVYDFNTQTGALRLRSAMGGIENPSYLAISRNGKKVYAVSEKDEGPGSISAYRFDASSGQLAFINRSASGGEGPCYIVISDAVSGLKGGGAGVYVFAANYNSGSLGIVRVNKDGSLDTTSVQSIQHTGSSINKESQTGPHVHSTVLSPDGHFLLSADLGVDRVYIYRFNAGNVQPLAPGSQEFVSITPGSGPRHICFHPNGKFVYVVNEMAGRVDAFDYKEGTLTAKQSITMLPPGFNGTVEAADIHLSPDGKFLYASNREVRNELSIYSIDKDGRLAFIAHQPVLGAVPRNFVIDPTGKFLLVANQKTNEVIVFRRDARSGLLRFTGKKIGIGAPSCLKFLN